MTNTYEQMPENYQAYINIQDRDPKYGEGLTQRVIEFEIPEGAKIGFAFGDISESVTDAVMCPTTPWLQLGGGAVEWAIADAAGHDIFEKDAASLMNALKNIQKGDSLASQEESAKLIREMFNLELTHTLEQIIQESLQITTQAEGEIAVQFGASVPVRSGHLSKKGIDTIVLTNVTPNKRSMNSGDMAQFTANSINAARIKGANSITIPAVGTGFAAAFGFGLSMPDSIRGFIAGARSQLATLGENHGIERIDYNVYAYPKQESAVSFAEQVLRDSVGGFDLVYPLGE